MDVVINQAHMPTINKSNQADEKSAQLPLISTWIKAHRDCEDRFFALGSFRLSKNEEWMICDSNAGFSVLINTESKQYEYLLDLIIECKEKSIALICQYDKQMKTGAALGVDEECPVIWAYTPLYFAGYSFKTVNHPYKDYPTSNPVPDERQPRARKPRSKAADSEA